MASNVYYIAAAIIVVLIAVILFYSKKTSGGPTCNSGEMFACTDTWYQSDGKTLLDHTATDTKCGADGKPPADGVGPSMCEVKCPDATQTPCWNATANQGVCIVGTSCPCTANSDCKNGGTCDPVKTGPNCACPPGFSGTRCEVKSADCKDKTKCGTGGICGTDGVSCSCKSGWDQNADTDGIQCNTCLGGRGPPGECSGELVGVGGILPIYPTTDATCINTDIGWGTESLNTFCLSHMGDDTGATWAGYCSNDTNANACRTVVNIGDWETNQQYCKMPKGWWVKAGTSQTGYSACNVSDTAVKGGVAQPPGFISVA